MCRELKKREHLSVFLRKAHQSALNAYTIAKGDDDFGEALDPPPIIGMYLDKQRINILLTPMTKYLCNVLS